MIPDGYQRHTRRSPVTDPWEPLYARETDDDAVHLALDIRGAHCNRRGFAHGGLISALADNAMGMSAVRRAAAAGAEQVNAVTVTLSVDFVDTARLGDWVEFHPTVLKAGRTLAFTECHVVCGERLVARSSATFRLG